MGIQDPGGRQMTLWLRKKQERKGGGREDDEGAKRRYEGERKCCPKARQDNQATCEPGLQHGSQRQNPPQVTEAGKSKFTH